MAVDAVECKGVCSMLGAGPACFALLSGRSARMLGAPAGACAGAWPTVVPTPPCPWHRWMGTARVWCLSGCVCNETTIDAHDNREASQSKLFQVPVTQAENCLIGVQITDRSRSGHHKFKVTAVMVSQSVQYSNLKETEYSITGSEAFARAEERAR